MTTYLFAWEGVRIFKAIKLKLQIILNLNTTDQPWTLTKFREKMKFLKFFLLFCFVTPSWAFQVETSQVVIEPYSDIVERTGKLAFKNTVLQSFKTNGFLNKLTVQENPTALIHLHEMRNELHV